VIRVLYILAVLTILAGTAGAFYVQFGSRPTSRIRLATAGLVCAGLLILGASLTQKSW
jgi:hypothetical protein